MKGNKCDWIIHGVFDKDKIVYHTHGLDKYGMTELELNMSLNQNQAMRFINLIAEHLIENNIIIKDEYVDEGNIFNCNIFFRRVKGIFGDGEENIRIILPDTNFLYPWDEGCEEGYKEQFSEEEAIQSL